MPSLLRLKSLKIIGLRLYQWRQDNLNYFNFEVGTLVLCPKVLGAGFSRVWSSWTSAWRSYCSRLTSCKCTVSLLCACTGAQSDIFSERMSSHNVCRQMVSSSSEKSHDASVCPWGSCTFSCSSDIDSGTIFGAPRSSHHEFFFFVGPKTQPYRSRPELREQFHVVFYILYVRFMFKIKMGLLVSLQTWC